MSQAESEQAQQEYAQMQQNYQIKKQSLQEALLKHNEDLKADIRKKIEEYLNDYNKSKGYNYIISYDANSFIYVKDTTYNITEILSADSMRPIRKSRLPPDIGFASDLLSSGLNHLCPEKILLLNQHSD